MTIKKVQVQLPHAMNIAPGDPLNRIDVSVPELNVGFSTSPWPWVPSDVQTNLLALAAQADDEDQLDDLLDSPEHLTVTWAKIPGGTIIGWAAAVAGTESTKAGSPITFLHPDYADMPTLENRLIDRLKASL
jgi:hypothetical protein